MYCPKCGAMVSDDNKKCPLCLTDLPNLNGKKKKGFFPDSPPVKGTEDFRGMLFFITLMFLAVGGVFLALDLVRVGGVTFSFYILAGLGLFYVTFLLPRWFKNPNPAVFFPVFFAVLMGCLLVLDLKLQGRWYLTFILPTLGGFFLLLEAAVILMRIFKRRKLIICGGLFIAMGNLSYVGEILYRVTYDLPVKLTYSILPLVFFCTVGCALLVIALIPPFRRYMERRFFI